MVNRDLQPQEILSILADPSVFSIGCVEAHSDHRFRIPALPEDRPGKEAVLSLDGEWYYTFAEKAEDASDHFHEMDCDVSSWARIRVPGHPELQGYGRPRYTDSEYPWDGHEIVRPGQIPQYENYTGSYVTFFTVPGDWKERRVRLRFDGAASALAVWVNGQFVGYHEDSFLPAEFEISAYLKEGENRLAARTWFFSSGSWLEDQDFWRLSGLFRSVSLLALPKLHIEDLVIQTPLQEDFSEAEVKITCRLTGQEDICSGITARLYAPDGSFAGETLLDRQIMQAEGRIPVRNPKLWSAEDPALYRLELALYGSELLPDSVTDLPSASTSMLLAENVNAVAAESTTGELGRFRLLETVTERVGIRRIEIRNSCILLNGKRIVFNGVNRHEFHHETGRAITYEDMLWDVQTMKRYNINAVRTSHYPNQSEFYRLCDEYGIYVIDETNLETHGTWLFHAGQGLPPFLLPDDLPEWKDNVLARGQGMLARDRNHASILLWSCGNESYGGENIYRLSQFFKKEDPDRPVHYEGTVKDQRFPDTSDVESHMYWWPEHILQYAANDPKKPFISCEYSFGMGNGCGGLKRYTELTRTCSIYQGGFIWDFIDQGLMTDGYLHYGGDYDERPNSGTFIGNGIVFADRSVSAKLDHVKSCYQNVDITVNEKFVELTNRFLFTDLSVFDLCWSLQKEGEILQSGILILALPPSERGRVLLPVEIPEKTGEYTMNVSLCLREDHRWAGKGHAVAAGQGVFRIEGDSKEALPADPDPNMCAKKVSEQDSSRNCSGCGANRGVLPAFHIEKSDVNYWVEDGIYHAMFCQNLGGLHSLTVRGRELLKQPPRPCFWRAPNDIDRGWQMPQKLGIWKIAGEYANAKNEKGRIIREDGRLEFTVRYRLGGMQDRFCDITYISEGNNCIRCRVHMDAIPNIPPIPEFGLLLTLPVDYRNVRYYGYGPMENYCDRLDGASLGVYDYPVEMTPFLRPQECGNRCGTRWVEILDERGSGLRLRAAQTEQPLEFSVLPYSPYQIENAGHMRELPESYFTCVKVLSHQMGLGGDDAWGSRPQKDCMFAGDREYTLEFLLEFV